jgi:hypothetical protein
MKSLEAQEMYTTYSGYYSTEAGPDANVKITRFELLEQP